MSLPGHRLAATCGALTLAAACGASMLPRAPWLENPTPEGVTVRWQTRKACEGRVALVAPDGRETVALEDGARSLHRVELGGLAAATRYRFEAQSCGEGSLVGDFVTAPAAATPFRFAVWGDSQSHPEVFGWIASHLALSGAALALAAGDLVGDGDDEGAWVREFFLPAGAFTPRIPILVARGNHDVGGYESRFAGPLTFFALGYAGVRFVVLDTNLGMEPGSAQRSWLEAELGSTPWRQARWRVVLMHHPLWSEGSDHEGYDGEPRLREALGPLLPQAGTDLVLQGHTHDYERGEVDGVLHVITGGGGGALDRHWQDLAQITVRHVRHHFLTVDVEHDRLTLQARDAFTGEPFDEVQRAWRPASRAP